MTKRRCTEINRCHLATCYDCRRHLIDVTATRMLEQGMDQDAVDQYRYPAINALAFEISAVEKPIPKAPKASKPVKALKIDADAIAAQLKAADSREAGREIIGKALVVELKAIAKALDLRGISRLRKDELVDHLINSTVGFRLDHEAIRTGAMS